MVPEIKFVAILMSAIYDVVLHFTYYRVIFSNDGFKRHFTRIKRFYAIHFFSGLIKAYVFANILKFTYSDTISEALQVSFWVWLGLVATTLISHYAMKKSKRRAIVIVNFYFFLELLGMGIILAYLG